MAFCYGVVALWPLPLDQEHILNVAPLFHIWGFCYTLIFPVYLRAFMVLLPAYKPAAVLEEFQKRRITTFAGGPSALYMGLRGQRKFRHDRFLQPARLPVGRRRLSGGAHSFLGAGDRIDPARRLGHVGRRADPFKSAQRRAQDRLGRHRAARLRGRGGRSRNRHARHADRRARRDSRARTAIHHRAIATGRTRTPSKFATAGSTPATSATTTRTATCSSSIARRR